MLFSRYYIARSPLSFNEITDRVGEFLWASWNMAQSGTHRLALMPREYLIPVGFVAAIVILVIAAKAAKFFQSARRFRADYGKADTKLREAKLNLIIADKQSAFGLLLVPIALLAFASAILMIYFGLQGPAISAWHEGR